MADNGGFSPERAVPTPSPLEEAKRKVTEAREAGRMRVDAALDKAGGGFAKRAVSWGFETLQKGASAVTEGTLNLVGNMVASEAVKAAKAEVARVSAEHQQELARLAAERKAKNDAARAAALREGIAKARAWVADMGPALGRQWENYVASRQAQNEEFGRKWRDGLNTIRLNAAERSERVAKEKADAIRKKMGVLSALEAS